MWNSGTRISSRHRPSTTVIRVLIGLARTLRSCETSGPVRDGAAFRASRGCKPPEDEAAASGVAATAAFLRPNSGRVRPMFQSIRRARLFTTTVTRKSVRPSSIRADLCKMVSALPHWLARTAGIE